MDPRLLIRHHLHVAIAGTELRKRRKSGKRDGRRRLRQWQESWRHSRQQMTQGEVMSRGSLIDVKHVENNIEWNSGERGPTRSERVVQLMSQNCIAS